MSIGKKIRESRRKANMTLEELSKKSGVALATLSRMETGKMPGTLKAHTRICKALGISVSGLYKELEDASKAVETSSDKKTPGEIHTNDKVSQELLIAAVPGKHMIPVITRISPGFQTQEETQKTGSEKFIYVLKGSVKVDIRDRSYRLKKGDSIYFDPSLKHRFANISKTWAEMISVTSNPS